MQNIFHESTNKLKMKLNSRVLSSVAVFAVTCVVSAAAYCYKTWNKEINEVMVFCKLQYNGHNCFDKLISYVEAAKNNVSVCMPSIHNPAIQGRLIKLIKEKNIKIRIIINWNRYSESTDFLLKELMDAGAEIKCRLMEPYHKHKFCLVDDRVLMTGTLNWGDDRSSDHWNYVYITSKTPLVDPVKIEFKDMWRTEMYLREIINNNYTNQETNVKDAATKDIETIDAETKMVESPEITRNLQPPNIMVTPSTPCELVVM